jgi:hypothetical protein
MVLAIYNKRVLHGHDGHDDGDHNHSQKRLLINLAKQQEQTIFSFFLRYDFIIIYILIYFQLQSKEKSKKTTPHFIN